MHRLARRRPSIALLFALLAGFTMLGASRTALAAVQSGSAACDMPGTVCNHMMTLGDCATGQCAVLPERAALEPRAAIVTPVSVPRAQPTARRHAGPEPPPPRTGHRPIHLI